MNERLCRQIVRERSGGLCEIDQCALATDCHHRRNRSQGGVWVPSNILHLSHDHHRRITNARNEYYSEGWLVRSYEDWVTKPVRMWHGVCVLDDSGGWTNLGFDPPAEEHTVGCEFWSSDVCSCGSAA